MKYLYGILILLALAVAALFLVPPLLDWERFKPEITERLEAITGRALAIDGPIAVSILPSPKLTVADLRIANAPGATVPDMARIKSLELALALGPLIGGEVAVTSLELVEPVVELERLADGRPNWLFERAAGTTAEGSAAGEPEADAFEPARIDSATVRNGTIVYHRGDGRPPERIERIDAELSARSLDGPFRAEGEFTVRGRTVAFQLATGTIGSEHSVPISLETTVGDEHGSALFEGSVAGIDGVPSFDGTMRVQASDLGALLSALDIDHGALPVAPLASALSGKGTFSASAETIAARALQVRLGESQATGAISWRDGERPSLDAEIALNRIDLDQYLPSAGEAEAAPAAADRGGTGPADDTDAAAGLQTIPEEIRQAIPGDIAATVDLEIGTLTWRQGIIRQARAELALADGVVTIRQGSALLPGGADVSLSGRLKKEGDGPWLEGVAEIAADDLRAVLSWLSVDVDAVPADRLRHLSASADLSAQGDRISTSNLDIRVDTTRIAGDAALRMGERPRLFAALDVDAVNLDAYLLAAGEETSAPEEAAAAAAQAEAAENGRTAIAGIDADVRLAIDSLIYDGVRLAGLELDGTIEDGALTLRRASVADALGASVALRGTARTVWTVPTVDLAVEGEARSLAGIAALLDIDPDIRAEAFGATTLRGSLAGGEEALTVDLTLAAASAEARLSGTMERPFGASSAKLALMLRAEDAATLARTAGLTPTAAIERLGALAIDGTLDGDSESVAIALNAETAGATLKVEGRVMDPLAWLSYSVAVDIVHPSPARLIEVVTGGAQGAAALGPMHVTGTVSGDSTVANIAGIDAMVGDNWLTGGVFLRLDRALPAISADMRAGVLDLTWLGGDLAAAGDAADGAATGEGGRYADTGIEDLVPAPERWSDEPIDFAILDRLSGTLGLDAEAVILGAYRIEQAKVDLAASEGTLTLRSLRGRLFDGALEAEGSLAAGSMPTGRVAFRLADADVAALLLEVAEVDVVSGRATIEGDVALQGRTAREVVGSLAGRATLTAREGVIDGVDLPAISRQIDALAGLETLDDVPAFVSAAERSLSGGRTAVHSLNGAIDLQDGKARIETFTIVAEGAVGDVAGGADLPAWQVDLTAQFRLVEHPAAPPVGVLLEGPIDRPERRYLTEEMQAHLVGIGLLSLARSQEAPTITIRKGAKAEPGTEMDRVLRDVFGDPEEGDEAVQAKETGDLEDGEEPTEAVPADGAPSEAPDEAPDEPAVEAPDEPAVAPKEADESAAEADAGQAADAVDDVAEAVEVEEPGGVVPSQEATGMEATDGEGEGAVPPPTDAPAPQPPPAPERDRGADFQDFLDDMLRSLDE